MNDYDSGSGPMCVSATWKEREIFMFMKMKREINKFIISIGAWAALAAEQNREY